VNGTLYMMFCLYMKLRTYLDDETISVTTKASFSVFQCLVTCVKLLHKYWQAKQKHCQEFMMG